MNAFDKVHASTTTKIIFANGQPFVPRFVCVKQEVTAIKYFASDPGELRYPDMHQEWACRSAFHHIVPDGAMVTVEGRSYPGYFVPWCPKGAERNGTHGFFVHTYLGPCGSLISAKVALYLPQDAHLLLVADPKKRF